VGWAYRDGALPPLLFYLTLPFLPDPTRGLLVFIYGGVMLAGGIWKLSGIAFFRLYQGEHPGSEVVLGYRRDRRPPRIAVLSGGAGMFILASLGEQVERLTCITPVQDPVEYYYRASGLFSFQNVYYVVPTPVAAKVHAILDDGSQVNIMHVDHNVRLAKRHVERLMLVPDGTETNLVATEANGKHNDGGTVSAQPAITSLPLTRLAADTLRDADAIILGPGSLFESILPNLLIAEVREAVQQSSAVKIFICNLMTEPGLTTGFHVGDHIRQIKQYGGFTPDYVLVNAQRLDPEVTQLYAEANQAPVYLEPDAYEETAVLPGQHDSQRYVVVEGSVVIETDLASSVVQYTASLDNPGERRAVRVLRHDPQKLTTAVLNLLRQA
jgi:hypothetical protein